MGKALKRAWEGFLGLLERSLARPYRPRLRMPSPQPGAQAPKKPEVAYAPPSRRLLYATALCLLALVALSCALILSIVLLGRAPEELTTSIVALSSTLAGIYIGRRGGDLGGR